MGPGTRTSSGPAVNSTAHEGRTNDRNLLQSLYLTKIPCKTGAVHKCHLRDEGHDLRGTGGAIRLAYDRGLLEPRFLVLYGDSYLRIDLQQLWNSAAASGAPMTMAVFENNGAHERSNVGFEDGRVRLYDKHASGRSARRMGHIDYGVSVLDRSVAERIPLGVYDLAELQHELSTSGEVAGYEVQDRYFEVGTPEGLAELEAFLSRTREKR